MMSRYARHSMLPEIGVEGQRRLSAARVAVVGAGGLGSSALYCLASVGIGHIRIVDADVVELSNLNRQFIHFEDDIGRDKAQSAGEKLRQYNRDIQIHATTVRLDDSNVSEHLSGVDAVLACVDNAPTRYLLNRFCLREGIPLFDGGVRGFEGYVLTVSPGVSPCYRCVFPRRDQEEGTAGVLGATAGAIGSMMAAQAVKALADIPISSYFHYVDLLSFRMTAIKAEKKRDCPDCGAARD